jgi:hypothetical protein
MKNKLNNLFVTVFVLTVLSIVSLDIWHLIMDRQYNVLYHIGQTSLNLLFVIVFVFGYLVTKMK